LPESMTISGNETLAQRSRSSPVSGAAERLTEFPRMGHAGRVAGTHEWVVRGLPCIIVYEIGVPEPDEVLVLGVFHGAQNRERE
jgi:toxin ParE1/3/4